MKENMIGEYMERMMLLVEESATLRERLRTLEDIVKDAEVEDARYRERLKKEAYIDFDYKGTVSTEIINKVMGWKRSEIAEEIIEGIREERRNEDT